MDEWKPAGVFFQGMPKEGISANGFGSEVDPAALSARLQVSCPESSQRVEQVVKDVSSARKSHKADREKLRRDRLNEQFMDLGNAIDSDRPRNDKASILADTIQMLKDLTSQVHKLKAENTLLSDESRELTQEKNELREEKATLKSEIDNLNAQYQQRLGCLYPWATVDPSAVMRPPSPYPFPIPVPVPSGPLPFHSPIPLYPLFQNQSPVTIPARCSSYHPYGSSNPYIEQQSTQSLPTQPQPSNNHHHHHPAACKHESQSSSSDQRCSGPEKSSAEFNDVVTELELKIPGSASPSSTSKTTNEQNSPPEGGRGCRSRKFQSKGSEQPDGSSSSRCSSPPGMPGSSSASNGGDSVNNNS